MPTATPQRRRRPPPIHLAWLPLSNAQRQLIKRTLGSADNPAPVTKKTARNIAPYQWIVNLTDLLREDLSEKQIAQIEPVLNKLSKIFRKFTAPVRDGYSRTYGAKFHPSDFDEGLVRKISPNSAWRNFIGYIVIALHTPGYNPIQVIAGAGNLRQLNASIAKFFSSRTKRADSEGETAVLHNLPNGFRLVELRDELSYRFEGRRMDNCVGRYWQAHQSTSDMHLWSLRDRDNKPCATIELEHLTVLQIEGSSNGPVDNQFAREALVEFFKVDIGSGKSRSAYSLKYEAIENLRDWY